MVRTKRFFSGLVFGYLQIGVNIAYTFATVPLALHYLTKEEFGIWAIITQIAGYLMLVEFGLSASVARVLADFKDDVNGGAYGNVIRTGNWIFGVQASILAVIGIILSYPLSQFLRIPEHLQATFVRLLVMQSVITALQLATRTTGSVLWSHQRHDMIGVAGIMNLLSSFLTLWLGFSCGLGLYSLCFSALFGYISSLLVTVGANIKFGYYPSKKQDRHFDFLLFKKLAKFGSGLFVINVGNQIAAASPLIIASKILGLEAATTWAIATKGASLAQTLVARIFEASAPSLAEMDVRGEYNRLERRFLNIVSTSGVLGILAMIGVSFLNEPFLEIWTSSSIAWQPINNFILGAFVLISSVARCYVGVAIIKKQVRGVALACVLEGVLLLVLGSILTYSHGFAGLLLAVCTSNFLAIGLLSVWIVYRAVGIKTRISRGVILKFCLILILIFIFKCAQHVFASSALSEMVAGVLFLIIISPMLWRFGLETEFRMEIEKLFSRRLRRRRDEKHELK
jgi:O-antigen/teichoic acid export membrane protein